MDQRIRKVIDRLAESHPGKFNYRFGLQTLPYHISAFKIVQAIYYVNDQKGSAEALKVMRYFLDTSSKWGFDTVKKQSVSDLMTRIADDVN